VQPAQLGGESTAGHAKSRRSTGQPCRPGTRQKGLLQADSVEEFWVAIERAKETAGCGTDPQFRLPLRCYGERILRLNALQASAADRSAESVGPSSSKPPATFAARSRSGWSQPLLSDRQPGLHRGQGCRGVPHRGHCAEAARRRAPAFFARNAVVVEKAPGASVPAGTPASASLAWISASVMPAFHFTKLRIRAVWASIRSERRSPPSGPDTTDPASRARAHQRIALEALRRRAAGRTRRDHLFRRSADSALAMPVSPLADRQLGSDPTRLGESS